MLNLTPHAIDIKPADATSLVIPPSAQVARVRVEAEPLGEVSVGTSCRVFPTVRTKSPVLSCTRSTGLMILTDASMKRPLTVAR